MSSTNFVLKFFALLIGLALVVASDKAHAQWVEPAGLHNESRVRFTEPKDITHKDFIDTDEKMRTWDQAVVWVPTGFKRSRRVSMQELLETYVDSGEKFPTAIYLHGCAGLWAGSSMRMKFLADNGFLAIGPASFARKKYAQSCNHLAHQGGMWRDAVAVRKIDAGHAIERAKSLPFVDANNMVLIGLSEGGITAATFRPLGKHHSVKVRVVEGWTCHSGWYDLVGINAPLSEPVLSLLGANDPWFKEPYLRGDCGQFMNDENGSKSIVYRIGKLSHMHTLLEQNSVQQETLAFLRQYVDLPMGVREVQALLTEFGYDPGPIDGAWGPKTLGALNALRANEALPPVSDFEHTSQKLLQGLKGH